MERLLNWVSGNGAPDYSDRSWRVANPGAHGGFLEIDSRPWRGQVGVIGMENAYHSVGGLGLFVTGPRSD